MDLQEQSSVYLKNLLFKESPLRIYEVFKPVLKGITNELKVSTSFKRGKDQIVLSNWEEFKQSFWRYFIQILMIKIQTNLKLRNLRKEIKK